MIGWHFWLVSHPRRALSQLSNNIRGRMMSEAAALVGDTPLSPGAAIAQAPGAEPHTHSEPAPVPYLPVNIQTESVRRNDSFCFGLSRFRL